MDMDARNQFYLYFLCLHLAFTTLDIPFLPVCRILEFFVPGLDPIQCFAFTGIGGGLSGDMDVGIDTSGSFTSIIYAVWTRYLSLPLRIVVLLALFLDWRKARPLVAAFSIPLLHPSFFHAYTSSNNTVASLISSFAWVVMVFMWIDLIWRCSLNAIVEVVLNPRQLQELPKWQRNILEMMFILAVLVVDSCDDMKEKVLAISNLGTKDTSESVVLDGKELDIRDSCLEEGVALNLV